MRIIAFLIIILNLNLFSEEIPQFRNKIAIEGATVYKTDENGNLEIITFADHDFDLWKEKEEIAYKLLDKPSTNIFLLDKINPYNTNELHYYNISTNEDKKVETNYCTYIVEKNILLYGVFDEDEGWGLNSSDPYDYNSEVPIAIFIDYDKYGKKYIENLMNKDLSMYSARYFEGRYVSTEDGYSYFDIKRCGGNTFAIDGYGTIASITTDFDSEFIISELYPEIRQIYIGDNTVDDTYQIYLNILDPNTLIVFEVADEKKGFKGIYTKVRE